MSNSSKGANNRVNQFLYAIDAGDRKLASRLIVDALMEQADGGRPVPGMMLRFWSEDIEDLLGGHDSRVLPANPDREGRVGSPGSHRIQRRLEDAARYYFPVMHALPDEDPHKDTSLKETVWRAFGGGRKGNLLSESHVYDWQAEGKRIEVKSGQHLSELAPAIKGIMEIAGAYWDQHFARDKRKSNRKTPEK